LKGVFLDEPYVDVDVMMREASGIDVLRKKPVGNPSAYLEPNGWN